MANCSNIEQKQDHTDNEVSDDDSDDKDVPGIIHKLAVHDAGAVVSTLVNIANNKLVTCVKQVEPQKIILQSQSCNVLCQSLH